MKAALVAGAGDVLGEVCARVLGGAGWRVVVAGGEEEEEGLERLALGLPNGAYVVAEPSVPGEATVAVHAARERFGRLDAVVYVAGGSTSGELEGADDEDLLEPLFAAPFAALALARDATEFLEESGGSLVFVGPSWGESAFAAAGEAARAGLVEATRAIARELGPVGIRANAVLPGWTVTQEESEDPVAQAAIRALTAEVPLRRAGRPEEVAAAVRWLVSEEAGWVTGQALHVAGGPQA